MGGFGNGSEYEISDKSNGMNLMALSAFIKSEYKPRVVISNITPKIVEASFPRLLNKSINFASSRSDNKISKILQNGLFDSQGIDSDVDSNL